MPDLAVKPHHDEGESDEPKPTVTTHLARRGWEQGQQVGDRVATQILAFEGDSQVTWFEGDWAECADWVRETRGPEALEPHRIKYKPLIRLRVS